MRTYMDQLLIQKHNTVQSQNKSTCMLQSFTGKSILQVPDTGTWVLDNTRSFLCSSILSFWITLACSKECKYHIFGQYWYTRNVPVLTNTGMFQYLGLEVYFFPFTLCKTGVLNYNSWQAIKAQREFKVGLSSTCNYVNISSTWE